MSEVAQQMSNDINDVAIDGSEEFQISGSEAWWRIVGSADDGRRHVTIKSDSGETREVSVDGYSVGVVRPRS